MDLQDRTEGLVEGLHAIAGDGAWSPDERHLAATYLSKDGFTAVLVDVDTLAWWRLGPAQGSMHPVWHPSGQRLLLNGFCGAPGPERACVHLTDVPGGESAFLAFGSTFFCVDPYWQGRWLLSRRAEKQRWQDLPRYRFYLVDEAGESEEVLADRVVRSIIVSPGGERAAAICLPPGATRESLPNGPYRLSVLEGPHGVPPREIAQGDYWWLRWSNAADRLLTSNTDYGSGEAPPIFVIDPGSGTEAPVQLADGSPLTGIEPVWAGDDSCILYIRPSAVGGTEIWSYGFARKRGKRLYPFEDD
ncbi:MAG: hypothetical protein FJX74_17350 [Armatimonadetes bacterium]|nr:hypothetical protein [Armatimonadota bacterium]